MKNFFNFLNSGAGLLILGFLVTTGGGSILTYLIQTENSNNERRFAMYKMRLEEAKALQRVFLENSTARVFYLNQIWLMLGDSNETRDDIKKYWQEKVTGTKDDWNKNLVYWQAQLRVLFKGDLDDLLENDEENLTREPSALNNLNENVYKMGIPKTVHGAFVDTHRTLHYIVFEWEDRENCKWQEREHCQGWKDLMALVNKQIKHLKLLHSCLSYRISGELLVDPYGPHAGFSVPAKCKL